MAKKVQKRKYTALIVLLVTAVLVATVLLNENPTQVWQAVINSNPWWLAAAGLCYLIYWLFDVLALHLLTHQLSKARLGFGQSAKVALVGTLFSCLTPSASGGQPMQIVRLKKHGVSVGRSSSILTLRFIVFQTSLVILTLILLFLRYNYFRHAVSNLRIMAIVGLTLNLMAALFALVASLFSRFIRRLVRSMINFSAKIRLVKHPIILSLRADRVIQEFAEWPKLVAKNKAIIWQQILISFIQMLFYFAIVFFVFKAISSELVSPLLVITAAALVWMASAFMPSPGASGGAEGMFMLFLSSVYHNSAVGAALLLWRFITFYLPIMFGGLMLFIESRKKLKTNLFDKLVSR